jgi:hypothetical protein
MSIDTNFNGSFHESTAKSAERSLDELAASPFETEESKAEAEARLGELVETIRSEFLLVSQRIENLETVEVTRENLPKIALVAEKIAALAEISHELSDYPELQAAFAGSVISLANAFLRVVGKKFSESKNPEEWLSDYSEMRNVLQNAADFLVRSERK